MFALIQKEIFHLLSSAMAYSLIIFFSGFSLVFCFFFQDNLLSGAYADLQLFFVIAPYLLLLTSSFCSIWGFAQEKKQKTLQQLLTFPLSDTQIVLAKFLPMVSLQIACLLPTLSFAYTLSQLTYPIGQLDTGAYVGSMLGLVLLSNCFCAIGLFCSLLTGHPINALLISLSVNFLLWIGLEELANLLEWHWLMRWSLHENFLGMAKGVIRLREIIYLLAVLFMGLCGSVWILQKKRNGI